MIKNNRAQSAVEYLLLLAVVAAVVMISFRILLPKTQNTTDGYFNTVSRAIVGGGANITRGDGTQGFENDPAPINGGWCGLDGEPLNGRLETCDDLDLPCGTAVYYRKCACPEPAFGGTQCIASNPSLATLDCTAQTSACADCTSQDDSCQAPEPTNCAQVTAGLTACSKKACTISRACGPCQGTPPAGTQECPQASVDVIAGTSWSFVSSVSACSTTVKCQRYPLP